MNNLTATTESLPKTGHVNEVCKEWLVREDGALAYKLQSQEINEFYKGNRQRNAVVREDFPTALHEQIKEQENAQRQVEAYRRRLTEQEEHDKRVAKEIADKLERDLQEQQQRELQESEAIAQRMQEIYVNMPPLPPPAARDKARPPPRPAKASTLQQQNEHQMPTTSNAMRFNKQQHHTTHTNQQQQLPPQNLQFIGDSNGYVGLSVNLPPTPQRQKAQPTANFNQQMKLSPEKYDQIMGNAAAMANQLSNGAGGLNVSRSVEQKMQQHADDIDVYVDPCDYESLKEIGLPMEEIKELSKKLKQEQKDALLAKRLQEMEAGEKLSQEERDRMLAIEAQDKELARMLQEREKAKIKRAKEKARLRKSQQQKDQTVCGGSSGSGIHCGPLLPLPQDCMSSLSSSGSSKQRLPITASPPYTSAQRHQPPQHLPTTEDELDMEAYSNPIDVLTNQQQRQPNGTLTNGSLTRDHGNNGVVGSRNLISIHHSTSRIDDDIYTLPVDNCRPTAPTTANQRPASLILGADAVTGQQQNSMTRSENFSWNSAAPLNGHHDVPSRMNYSKSVALDNNSSPTPPYMPIQGTRRSNSGEERKKKSKDKCTHQ